MKIISGPCNIPCCPADETAQCPEGSGACDGCSDLTLTISGFSGQYSRMNGDYTLGRLGCGWYNNGGLYTDCAEGWDITLSCSDGDWILYIELYSWGVEGSGTCDNLCGDNFESDGRPNTTDCPPTGSYTMNRGPFSDGCDSIPTASIS